MNPCGDVDKQHFPQRNFPGYGQSKVEMALGVEVGCTLQQTNLARANHPCPNRIYTSSHSLITSQLCQYSAGTGTINDHHAIGI